MQVIRLNRLNYMENDFAYDPVTALSEVDAKGEIAVIFNDIRCTMQIPILTSIWRGLASIENGVSSTWRNIKPMYQTQAPFDTLANVLRKIDLIPKGTSKISIRKIGLEAEEFRRLRDIIKAYNRSNGLNFLTMNALINSESQLKYIQEEKRAVPKIASLVKLLHREEIADADWKLVVQANSLGASTGIKTHVATLWRHLAYWPEFLKFVHQEFCRMNQNRVFHKLSETIVKVAQCESRFIDKKQCNFDNLPIEAQRVVSGYASSPVQVARMVVVGNMLEKWTESWMQN